jgi:hypothetical protein
MIPNEFRLKIRVSIKPRAKLISIDPQRIDPFIGLIEFRLNPIKIKVPLYNSGKPISSIPILPFCFDFFLTKMACHE